MDKEKINNILKDVQNKSNKDLIWCRDTLISEFDNTKQLIIELTRHLDDVEENYNIVNKEIGKRMT